jgi:hypothetical protein
LWHGTGINYVIWGAYWGTIIILSNVFAQEIGKLTKWLKINTDAWGWKVFQTLRTFLIFTFGLLISTFVGIGGLSRYFGTVLNRFQLGDLLQGEIYSLGLNKVNLSILLLSILLLFVVEVCQQRTSVRKAIARQNPPIRWLTYSLAFFFVVFLGIYGTGYSTRGFAYAFF